jgi:hypothetical protein
MYICVATLCNMGPLVWIIRDVEPTSLFDRSPLHVIVSPSLMNMTGLVIPIQCLKEHMGLVLVSWVDCVNSHAWFTNVLTFMLFSNSNIKLNISRH